MACICDIVGNALADEATEQAAKTLQPPKKNWIDGETLSKEAFMICIRLALTQARVWELTNESFLYECPPELVDKKLTFKTTCQGFA